MISNFESRVYEMRSKMKGFMIEEVKRTYQLFLSEAFAFASPSSTLGYNDNHPIISKRLYVLSNQLRKKKGDYTNNIYPRKPRNHTNIPPPSELLDRYHNTSNLTVLVNCIAIG